MNKWSCAPLIISVLVCSQSVYAEIFKTPSSDKWLGLYSTDIYSALDIENCVNRRDVYGAPSASAVLVSI